MEKREELVRELASYGIYQARRMSVEDMRVLLTELQRVDELSNENKTIGDK
ncbi:hypothetical protein [Halolactibacillus halophilus]|uniref:Fur-regulated basic protein A n=1 Tax=Halolactibacillus halophilus TaxID=306540 RepID=A0ABQ0VIB8_9BACI|nr:hypothetical protein [Halolactibacillus halophilus]GEM00880.1 hypothetical protein HHA03_04120 [Halolactibacillus halophilus]